MSSEKAPHPVGRTRHMHHHRRHPRGARGNVEPIYNLLHELGMRTTRTVWPISCPEDEGSRNFLTSETPEDNHHLEFVRELMAKGVEITWHGASMESSPRERLESGPERFRELLPLSLWENPYFSRHQYALTQPLHALSGPPATADPALVFGEPCRGSRRVQLPAFVGEPAEAGG